MSVTIAGKTTSELNIKLLDDLDEPGTPAIRKRSTKIPGKAGRYSYGDEYGVRTFNLRFLTTGTNTQEEAQNVVRGLVELLTDSQGDPKEVELTLSHEPGKSYTVKFDHELGVERYPAGVNTFTLPLVATQPYAKGDSHTVNATITSIPDSISINNNGNVEAPVIIRIKNNGTTTINGFDLSKIE